MLALLPSCLLLLSTITSSTSTSTSHAHLSTQTLPLYHRYLLLTTPITPAPEWTKRGLIHLDTNTDQAWLDEVDGGLEELELGETVGEGGAYYQVAVGLPLGPGEEEGERKVSREGEGLSIILRDACVRLHDPQAAFKESISLYYAPHPQSHFVHFNYESTPIKHCKGQGSGDVPAGLARGRGEIEVRVERIVGAEPVIYKEAAPIFVNAEGKIVQPVQEKSFIQKYWIYGIPLVLVLMMAPGPEEEAAPAK